MRIGPTDLARLAAIDGPRPRICLHEGPQDLIQRMVVLMRKGEELPPHCIDRATTQLVLSGNGEMIIYDDKGNVTETFKIGGDGVLCYTLPAGCWHTKRLETDMVFFEILPGPYLGRDVRIL